MRERADAYRPHMSHLRCVCGDLGELLVFASGAAGYATGVTRKNPWPTGTDPSEQLIVALHSHVEAMSNIGKARRP